MALSDFDRSQLAAFSADPSGYQGAPDVAPTFDANAQGSGWTSGMDAPTATSGRSAFDVGGGQSTEPLRVPIAPPPAAPVNPAPSRIQAMIQAGALRARFGPQYAAGQRIGQAIAGPPAAPPPAAPMSVAPMAAGPAMPPATGLVVPLQVAPEAQYRKPVAPPQGRGGGDSGGGIIGSVLGGVLGGG